MKTAVGLLPFLIGVNVLAAFAGEAEVLPPPVANQPWELGETGAEEDGAVTRGHCATVLRGGGKTLLVKAVC